MEWARSIGNRPSTLITITQNSNYKNHMILDNTILKRFCYILNILDSSSLFPFCIGSMGESCVGTKVDDSIAIEKYI